MILDKVKIPTPIFITFIFLLLEYATFTIESKESGGTFLLTRLSCPEIALHNL